MIEGLLRKGWIEQRGAGNDTFYRITDEGLAAKMAPVRIYNQAFAVDRRAVAAPAGCGTNGALLD
jgi:DNA-binding transcriptional regulator PaaX